MAKKTAAADIPQDADTENGEAGHKKPERVYRIGNVSASVFLNEINSESGQRVFRSASLQKRYLEKDGDGEAKPKYTSSFGLAELPQAMRVLQLAQSYIESHEAKLDID